eukprot:343035-Amphidinium_carterae.1
MTHCSLMGAQMRTPSQPQGSGTSLTLRKCKSSSSKTWSGSFPRTFTCTSRSGRHQDSHSLRTASAAKFRSYGKEQF